MSWALAIGSKWELQRGTSIMKANYRTPDITGCIVHNYQMLQKSRSSGTHLLFFFSFYFFFFWCAVETTVIHQIHYGNSPSLLFSVCHLSSNSSFFCHPLKQWIVWAQSWMSPPAWGIAAPIVHFIFVSFKKISSLWRA